MERLKITLVGLVLVLALTVAYGYGCGGGSDGDGGGTGIESVGADSDGQSGDGTGPVTNSEAADGEDGSEGDGEDGTEAEGDGEDGSEGDGADGSQASDGGSEDGGDGGDGSSGAPLTKAKFIEQGDAICAKVPEKYTAIAEELEQQAQQEGKPKPTTAEVNLKAAVPPLPEAAQELEELVPPKGDEPEAEAILAALEAATKGLEQNPTAPLFGKKSPFAEFQKLTVKYGFQVCNQL